VSEEDPALGSQLHFKIALAAGTIAGRNTTIDAFGRVVRVETHGESIEPCKGVAVTIERFKILAS
jgi:hypothetical protein